MSLDLPIHQSYSERLSGNFGKVVAMDSRTAARRSQRATRQGLWLAAALGFILTGCVDRRFVITTDPPGAIVYDERNQPISASPADRQFTYYGKYRFTLVHDGYETLVVEEKVNPPWYEYIGLDFASEIVVPFILRDVRHFHYVLQPKQLVSEDPVRARAEVLRAKGKTIGTPLPAKFPVPVPGVSAPPTGVPAAGTLPPAVTPASPGVAAPSPGIGQPNPLPPSLPPSLPPVPQLGTPSPR